ncbi:winged helix-turn-helix domain-containing protein [Nitrososphaera viennensis]|nr:winged helix-turn-helix domain-containing protein [Nitrososphaera viennensis]
MRYRSRMDIASAILDVAKDGALKTAIMYKAYMSFPQLNEYLELLLSNGLLEYVPEQKMYHTTRKGKRFLDNYGEVGRALLPKENNKNAAMAEA